MTLGKTENMYLNLIVLAGLAFSEKEDNQNFKS
jgi:hypothetical protein